MGTTLLERVKPSGQNPPYPSLQPVNLLFGALNETLHMTFFDSFPVLFHPAL